jgi:hypothetical protein
VPERFDRRDTLFCVVVVLLGVAWRANALAVGPLSDDYLHHGMVHGLVAGSFAPWDLYALFADEPAARAGQLSAGMVPWWTAADFRGEVLRPLPSLLLWVDHTAWPRQPVVHHVHSLLWWAALLAVTGWSLRRLLPRSIAWTALVLFAVDPSASMPVAWLANRAALVSATLGFVAVVAHLRWRRDGRGGPGWAAVAMVATFAAGEYGFVALGYVVAYEAFGHRRRDRDEPAWALRLAPALVPAVAYLAWHVAGGYGMVGAEFYAHPFEDPLGYLRWLWLRGPRLVAAVVAPLPASTAVLAERSWIDPSGFGFSGPMAAVHAHLVLAWLAIATAAAVAWVLRGAWTDDECRTLKWLTVGAVVGTLPVAVAPSHARLLLLSQLGGCALVAGLLVAAARTVRRGSGWRRGIAGLTLGLGAWGHGPADAWLARAQIDDYARLSQTATEATLGAGDVAPTRRRGVDVGADHHAARRARGRLPRAIPTGVVARADEHTGAVEPASHRR